MNAALPFLLMLGAVVLWAVMLARLPMDRAAVNVWKPLPSEMNDYCRRQMTRVKKNQLIIREIIEKYAQREDLERQAILDRWADDGGLTA